MMTKSRQRGATVDTPILNTCARVIDQTNLELVQKKLELNLMHRTALALKPHGSQILHEPRGSHTSTARLSLMYRAAYILII